MFQQGVCSYSGAAGRFAHSGPVKSVDAPTWGRGRGSAGSYSWALPPPVHGVEGASVRCTGPSLSTLCDGLDPWGTPSKAREPRSLPHLQDQPDPTGIPTRV